MFSRIVLSMGALVLASTFSQVWAAMPQHLYKKALKIAEKKVIRETSVRASTAGALTSPMVARLFGRYYQVGDEWDMATWRFENAMNRLSPDSATNEQKWSPGGIFHYQVTDVKTGAQPQVTIEITQREEFGFKIADPRVERLVLVMNDRTEQREKIYYIKTRTEPLRVSAQGLRAAFSVLELFPLDAPDIETASMETINSLPALPKPVQNLANQIGYKPDLSKSSWFEQDDFFGRPIQILWQHGDPWPTYFKTPNGIAILVRHPIRHPIHQRSS